MVLKNLKKVFHQFYKYPVVLLTIFVIFAFEVKAQQVQYFSNQHSQSMPGDYPSTWFNRLPGNPGGLNKEQSYLMDSTFNMGWDVALKPRTEQFYWSEIKTFPFPFYYNGNPVNTFRVSCTGALQIAPDTSLDPKDTSNVPHQSILNYPSPAVTPNTLFMSNTFRHTTESYVFSKTFGEFPNRQFWVYFHRFYPNPYNVDYTNIYYSYVFEESTNKFYIVHQRNDGISNDYRTNAIMRGIQFNDSNALYFDSDNMFTNFLDIFGGRSGIFTENDDEYWDNMYFEFFPKDRDSLRLLPIYREINGILATNDHPYAYHYQSTQYNYENYKPIFRFKNLGSDTLKSCDFHYQYDKNNHSKRHYSNLDIFPIVGQVEFSTQMPLPIDRPRSFRLKVWADSVNGFHQSFNPDTGYYYINLYDSILPRKTLVELFDESTVSDTTRSFNLWSKINNRTDVVPITYPSNAISTGDPYATIEGTKRQEKYYCNYSPFVCIDGFSKLDPLYFNVGEDLLPFQNTTAFTADNTTYIGIAGKASICQQTKKVKINLNLTSYIDYADTYQLQIAIVEKKCTNNLTSNGPSKFRNVVKKMIPDPNGIPLGDLDYMQSVEINQSFTFNGSYRLPQGFADRIDFNTEHSVEDFTNLGVVVWVENNRSGRVEQSEFFEVTQFDSVLVLDTICQGSQFLSATGNSYTTSGTFKDTLSCDSVIFTNLFVSPFQQAERELSLCLGQTYTLPSGATINSSGVYVDTTQNQNSCDTAYTFHLTFDSVIVDSQIFRVCQGDSIQIGSLGFFSTDTLVFDSMLAQYGCDSVNIIKILVDSIKSSQEQRFLCQGDSINFSTQVITTSGTYFDTLNSSNGCDSILSFQVNVKNNFFNAISQTMCPGDFYFSPWGSVLYNQGIYRDTISTLYGCDSVFEVSLNIVQIDTTTIMDTVCMPSSYLTFTGKTIDSTGIYFDTLANTIGCDSIIKYDLSFFNPSFISVYDTLCQGDTFYSVLGLPIVSSGNYYDSLLTTSGCDSVYSYQLIFNPIYSISKVDTLCQGDSLQLATGNWVSTSGTYFDTIPTVLGCDSAIETNLWVNPSYFFSEVDTICNGDFVLSPLGNILANSGVFLDTLTTQKGCDSVVAIQLTVNPSQFKSVNDTLCQGDSLQTPSGRWLSTTSTLVDTFQNIFSCDSLIETNLWVNPTYFITQVDTICNGDSVLSPLGSSLFTTGTYYDTLTTFNGCDSVISIQLQVNPTYHSSFQDTLCQGDSLQTATGRWIQTQGSYFDTLQSQLLCDSVIETQLWINPTYFFSITDTICNDQTYFSPGGNLLSTTGTYLDTLNTQNSCDSVIEVNLQVNPTYFVAIHDTICQGDTYTLPNGGVIINSGTYFDTLTSAHLCDSIIQTTLWINPSYQTTVFDSICNGELYLLPSGTQIMQSGIYFDTLSTTNGCDSAFIINLQVRPTYFAELFDTICANQSYLSPEGKLLNTTGVYFDSLQTKQGCDSLFKINLWVNPTYSQLIFDTLCHGDSLQTAAGTWVSTAGIYVDTLQSQNGCDSVVETQVWVNPTYFQAIADTICFGETYQTVGGNLIDSTGIYADYFQTKSGCDSIIETSLWEKPLNFKSQAKEICQGESFTLPSGVVVNQSGVYTDTLNGALSCDSIIETNLMVRQKQVFSGIMGDSLIKAAATYSYYIDSTLLPQSVWSIKNGNFVTDSVGGSVQVTWVPQTEGRINVVGLDQDTICAYSDSLKVSIAIGVIKNGNSSNEIKIVPQPSDGKFAIQFREQLTGEIQVKIYNLEGKLLYEEVVKNQSGTIKIPIDISIAQGLYLLNITNEGNQYQLPVVIR